MARLLIVDDEPLIRMDIRGILEDAGYEVVDEASDGFEAITKCKEHEPDLVIMDIKMPVLDGLTASKRIMKDGTTNGIILLTAYSDKQFIEKAKEFGALNYLVKPLNESSLIPAVEVSLSKADQFKNMSTEIEDLSKKLSDRKIIEKAKGKLMERENISEEEAYKKIRDISMKNRTSMAEVSETLVLIDD